MQMLKALFISLRPKQWSKNVVIFVAFIITLNQYWQPFTPQMYVMLTQATIAFVLFCVLSGCVYLLNDLADVEKDRLHPTKRLRPLPSGRLPVNLAIFVLVVLLSGALAGAYWLDRWFALIGLTYFLVNVGYSLLFKNWVIVDLFALSAGFVLRAFAGAVVIGVPISPWLYVVMQLGSLFLAINKRRNELVLLRDDAVNHRSVLGEYSLQLFDEMTAVVTSSLVMAYSLYTFSAENLPKNHSMMLTIPFVLYGIFRYLYLVHIKNQGGDPSELLVTDRPLLMAIILLGLSVLAVLYFNR
jgi:4-hydroxybenzoate polyprenyltransferase